MVRLATGAAQRGSRKAVDFLLRESLVPDPVQPPTTYDAASDGVPNEVIDKLEAAMGLVAALISGTGGSSEAVTDLLRQSEPWLAKTVAARMAYTHVMDPQFSQIMDGRGLVQLPVSW